MHRAWVVLLAGCGFQASAANGGDPPSAPDGGMTQSPPPPGDGSSSAPNLCWQFIDKGFGVAWSTCPTATVPSTKLEIANDVNIDTSTGKSSINGLSCVSAVVKAATDKATEDDEVCAVVLDSLTLDAGRTLSATGSRPLAIFAHKIDIAGTIDVASHSGPGGRRGAGSGADCNPGTVSSKDPVGANGGSFGRDGGLGGNYDHTAMGSTISPQIFRGGCDGSLNHGTSPLDNLGAGGGAVWIASDMGLLHFGTNAKINASGAGGLGGAAGHGGSGGGSGGLIVIQSSKITADPAPVNIQIFANGGNGGGGGNTDNPGSNGSDPAGPGDGGSNGAGGNEGAGTGGFGGEGFHGVTDAKSGANGGQSSDGGGGGGGGAGVFRIDTDNRNSVLGVLLSPFPVLATH